MTTPKTSLLHDFFQGVFASLLFAANAVYFTSEPKTFLGTALFIGLAAFLLYPILVSCFNLITRTNWAQGKRKTAGETLSKDITWLCQTQYATEQTSKVFVYIGQKSRDTVFISSPGNPKFSQSRMVYLENLSGYQKWLHSHSLAVRMYLSKWNMPESFEITLSPLSAHEKMKLFSQIA